MKHPVPVVDVDPAEAARLAANGQMLLLDVREHGGGMSTRAAPGVPVVRTDGTPGEIA